MSRAKHCPTITDLSGIPERPPLNIGEVALDSIRAHGFCGGCNNLITALDNRIAYNRCVTAALKHQQEAYR